MRDVQVFEPHPRKHSENVALLARAIQHRGLSVLVAQRACIQIKRTSPAPAAAARSGCSACQAAPTAD